VVFFGSKCCDSQVSRPSGIFATPTWPCWLLAGSGLARISCAVGGLAGPATLLPQPVTTSAEVARTSQVFAFTALILAPACRSSVDFGVVEGQVAREKAWGRNDLLDDENRIDQLGRAHPGLEPIDQPRPDPAQPLELLP